MSPTPLDQAQVDQVLSLVKQGRHLRDIVRITGVSGTTVQLLCGRGGDRRYARFTGGQRLHVKPSPRLSAQDFRELFSALDVDGEGVESAGRRLGYERWEIMRMVLGQHEDLPFRYLDRQDLDPNLVCSYLSSADYAYDERRRQYLPPIARRTLGLDALGEVVAPSRCAELLGALRSGLVCSDLTGRLPADAFAESNSFHPQSFRWSARHSEYWKSVGRRASCVRALRVTGLRGERPDVATCRQLADGHQVHYYDVWLTCVQQTEAMRDPEYRGTSEEGGGPVYGDLGESVRGLLESLAREALEARPGYGGTAEEMWVWGDFAWVSSSFPRARSPEFRVYLDGPWWVSEHGDVWANKGRQQLLKRRFQKLTGVPQVHLGREWVDLDRVVCTAFRGLPPWHSGVLHVNGDRSDCRAGNLAWARPEHWEVLEKVGNGGVGASQG